MIIRFFILIAALVIVPRSANAGQAGDSRQGLPRIFVFKINDATRGAVSNIPEILRDALSRSLAETGEYRVIPNIEVPGNEWSPFSDVNPPGNAAEKLGADFAITGRITRVDEDRTALAYGVKIAIQVSLYDADSRELVFGSIGEGSAKRGRHGCLSCDAEAGLRPGVSESRGWIGRISPEQRED